MQYPTLPAGAKSINFASSAAYTPLQDIVWSFDYAISGNSSTEGGFCLFLIDSSYPLSGGNGGIDLGYSGLSATGLPYSPKPGLSGAILGVGFDTTGLFAASAAIGAVSIRDGINSSNVYKNSITIRDGFTIGSTQDYSYDTYAYTVPITSLIDTTFNIVESAAIYKTIRARLGNFGRTIYVDYRYSPNEDFINILTKTISAVITDTTYYKVGVSFATPISSSNANSTGNIYFKNFHTEGATSGLLSATCIYECGVQSLTGLCNYGVCTPLDTTVPYGSCIDPEPDYIIDSSNFAPPSFNTYDVLEIQSSDSSNVYHYLSEGTTAGVDTCNPTTCFNIASAIDLFNFGYKLSCIELNTVLDRIGQFSYANSLSTVTCTMTSFGTKWKLIDSSLNTFTSDGLTPEGRYTGTRNLSVIYVR